MALGPSSEWRWAALRRKMQSGQVDLNGNEYWSMRFEDSWAVRGRKVLEMQQRW